MMTRKRLEFVLLVLGCIANLVHGQISMDSDATSPVADSQDPASVGLPHTSSVVLVDAINAQAANVGQAVPAPTLASLQQLLSGPHDHTAHSHMAGGTGSSLPATAQSTGIPVFPTGNPTQTTGTNVGFNTQLQQTGMRFPLRSAPFIAVVGPPTLGRGLPTVSLQSAGLSPRARPNFGTNQFIPFTRNRASLPRTRTTSFSSPTTRFLASPFPTRRIFASRPTRILAPTRTQATFIRPTMNFHSVPFTTGGSFRAPSPTPVLNTGFRTSGSVQGMIPVDPRVANTARFGRPVGGAMPVGAMSGAMPVGGGMFQDPYMPRRGGFLESIERGFNNFIGQIQSAFTSF